VLTAHRVVAVCVLACTFVTAAAGLLAYRRGRAGTFVPQTLLVAQVGLGLLLLSSHHRAAQRLHYAYGTLALAAVLAPWLYAPEQPRKRLLWFALATLVAGALAVRAYMTGG
jgi:hypothetical protein